MIENLKRIREPLAWALVVLAVANVVLGLVALVQQLQQDVPLFDAFDTIGTSLMNPALAVALIVVVCTCFFIAPATPRAHQVTLAAAWVLTIGVVLTLICLIMGAMAAESALSRTLELIGAALDLILKAIAAAALWLLLRGVGSGRIDVAPAAPSPEAAEAEPTPPVAATSWSRDQAVGSVWGTATEAAAGAPGASRLGQADLPESEDDTPSTQP